MALADTTGWLDALAERERRGRPLCASWWLRIAARLLDLGCVALTLSAWTGRSGLGPPWGWNLLTACLLGALDGACGATPGKLLLGLRVVDEESGRPLGVGRGIVRKVLHAVDHYTLIGWLWPLVDRRRQTFADKLAGSVVVRIRR